MSFFKKLKSRLPSQESLQKSRSLWFLRSHISPGLFHLNRRSVSGGVAIGFGLAWIPIPIQMISAACLSILLHRNIAVSIFSTLITNPITMPPMYFFAYWVGTVLMGIPVVDVLNAEMYTSFSGFKSSMAHIWEPLLLGCFIVGIASSAIGYFGTQLIWRWSIVRRLKKRQKRHAALFKDDNKNS